MLSPWWPWRRCLERCVPCVLSDAWLPASDQTLESVWIAFRDVRFGFDATSATVRSSSPKL